MATSMLGMNGLCRKAGALLLFTLLSGVMCQDPSVSSPTGDVSIQGGDASLSGQTTEVGVPTTATTASGGAMPTLNDQIFIAGPVVKDSGEYVTGAEKTDPPPLKEVVPDVKCVEKEDLHSSTVKAEVRTENCEATKTIIEENPAGWCHQDNCQLTIFQDGKTMLVSSNENKPGTLENALQSENLKNKLGVTKTEIQSPSRFVFVGLLVTGLLAAIALTVGYFKFQRRPAAKGSQLAQEASLVDPENQGNTLASEAPLNPPPETQEKPNINGESPEAEKTQSPPPTNGHSNAKTADTEL